MAEFDWQRFYQFTKDSLPHPLVLRAVALLGLPGHPRQALDLGVGAGRDTRYLLAQGFHVTAVDQDPQAVALLARLAQPALRVVQAPFEDFAFATYDLINAQFALPFLPERHFRSVFERVKGALQPRGIFAGQFFGIHDQWNTPDHDHTMTFLTREAAEERLLGLEVLEIVEEDVDGHVADGSPKHWHAFHILARKQPGINP
jgi:tellurite methyltransferase